MHLLPGFSRFDFSSLQKASFQNMEWGFFWFLVDIYGLLEVLFEGHTVGIEN